MASPSFGHQVTFDIKDVSHSVAQKFKRDFATRADALKQYFAATKFVPLFTGDIHVKVFSYSPPVSHALLPAWDGQRGQMVFAASRAKDGTAAILHELGHVHAPNEARFLTEGYSIYLEELIGNLKAYPTFGDSIETAAKAFGAAPLAAVKMDRFDAVATQHDHEIGDSVGLETAIPGAPNSQGESDRLTYAYLISGSFVKYLINAYGLDRFKTLYGLSPLTPGVATVADPTRYQTVYGKSLAQLETEWRNWFATQ
jgi:hypothetical protein